MGHRRLAVLVIAALLGATMWLAASFATAAPPSRHPARAAATSSPASLRVSVRVNRFAVAGRRTTATATATATLTNFSGKTTTSRQKVTLAAATGGSCKVLHLLLEQLNLNLLGLNAHLDRVRLDITGRARDGALGRLFCRLSQAKIASRAAARSLNAQLARSKAPVLRFSARLSPQATASQAAGATCQVLDLVLGPLNLELLGLVVDLDKVHLNVTATRGGGVLGDLFCKLADGA
jgi:hypothetical protein